MHCYWKINNLVDGDAKPRFISVYVAYVLESLSHFFLWLNLTWKWLYFMIPFTYFTLFSSSDVFITFKLVYSSSSQPLKKNNEFG